MWIISQFLRGIDEDLKPKQSTGVRKLKSLKMNMSMAKNLQAKVEAKVAKPKEVADYPKIDMVRVVPTAMDPKEVGNF